MPRYATVARICRSTRSPTATAMPTIPWLAPIGTCSGWWPTGTESRRSPTSSATRRTGCAKLFAAITLRDRPGSRIIARRILGVRLCWTRREELRTALGGSAPAGCGRGGRWRPGWRSASAGRWASRAAGRRCGPSASPRNSPVPAPPGPIPPRRRPSKRGLQAHVDAVSTQHPTATITLWAEDEHRLGLLPVMRRIWAPKGQRPTVGAPPLPVALCLRCRAPSHRSELVVPVAHGQHRGYDPGAGSLCRRRRDRRPPSGGAGAGWGGRAHRPGLVVPEGIDLVYLPPPHPTCNRSSASGACSTSRSPTTPLPISTLWKPCWYPAAKGCGPIAIASRRPPTSIGGHGNGVAGSISDHLKFV